MKILLFGYGRMGKAIEKIAKERGNEISHIINTNNRSDLDNITKEDTDVVIEFTRPESGFDNIMDCLKKGIPVVSGTTGWLDKLEEVHQTAKKNNTAFFYASNFSVGVNLFFALNKQLAKLMNSFNAYNVDMEEIHHIHKLDAPSGTAITLAEGVYENIERKSSWNLEKEEKDSDIAIKAVREGEVPGTHLVNYRSKIDAIEIKHTAHNRQGFALGAVLAAEFLKGRQGIFGMNDLLNIK
jgi:4-hydroxy-tetrahydrodipicolinate reductase